MSIKKSNKTNTIMEKIQVEVPEESSYTEDEQIIKSTISNDISMLEEDAVALIEKLPTLMKLIQEEKLEEKIKKLEMDVELKEEQYHTTLPETKKGDKGKE
ncbi:16167_t:CDS:2 [Acaulospora morrowiae]|uniref:16167_t:CDS:1 n=1 Tax=Acaulospora morrowiae TaxID=94023 RepID=A0A9N8Z8Y7_9GLOM|nr:16167_t:CDS:2 [Acaulospora morrowiae]